MFKALFGGGAPEPAKDAPDASLPPPTTTPKKEDKKDKDSGDHYQGFDPSALERAAKAARDLESTKHAKDAIKISLEEEKTKQTVNQKEMEEAKLKAKALEVERTRIFEQERRKTLESESRVKQQQASYQDQLARKRHQDQLASQNQMRQQELKQQEQSAMRIEQIKRQTAEYEASLREKTDRSKVLEETKGRIEQERVNWDLHLERSRMEALEFRKTVIEGVKETGKIVGAGVKDFITDSEKLSKTVGVVTCMALGIYAAKISTGVVGRLVEARLGKPPLIRETSRISFKDALMHPIKTFVPKTKTKRMENVVLEPKLHQRLEQVSLSTFNTKSNRAPYRHMLLYGPPGTGKTMFAKNLAQTSGMDYAVLTGGDVAPLGRDGVTEMHKLFDWANTSRKGLLIFVDEADAFLRKRTNETISEDLRNALNAFLYRTGEASTNFMIVFASNQPEQLDWAVNDRTDEIVHFALPGEVERQRMIKQYFEMYVVNPQVGGGMFSKSKKIEAEALEDADFAAFAKRTKGFSGREITKLAIAWQAAAYGTKDAKLTLDMMEDIIDQRIEAHMQKYQWAADGELEMDSSS